MGKAETIRDFLQIGSTYAISDFEDFDFDDFFQEQPDRLKIASLDKNLNNKLIKEYVIIEHCGHTGDFYVYQTNILEEVEKILTSNGGYINPFCSFQVVFFKGEIKEFDFYVIDNKQKIKIDKETVIYDTYFYLPREVLWK